MAVSGGYYVISGCRRKTWVGWLYGFMSFLSGTYSLSRYFQRDAQKQTGKSRHKRNLPVLSWYLFPTGVGMELFSPTSANGHQKYERRPGLPPVIH